MPPPALGVPAMGVVAPPLALRHSTKIPAPAPGSTQVFQDVDGGVLEMKIMKGVNVCDAQLRNCHAEDCHIRNCVVTGGVFADCHFRSCQVVGVTKIVDCKLDTTKVTNTALVNCTKGKDTEYGAGVAIS